MNIKKIDHRLIPEGRVGNGAKSLSVSSYGIFRFNRVAERDMGLKTWKFFDFAEDTDTKKWFLYKSDEGFEMKSVRSGTNRSPGVIHRNGAYYISEKWGFNFDKTHKAIRIRIENPVEWAGKQYYPLTFISKPEELSKNKTDIYDAN